jgi:hypothetical protein
MEIALGPVDYWSYPSWPSHLDHFILSNEFFELLDGSSQIETIRIEDYLTNGFSEYENNMSDHRPVAMSFEMTNSLSLDELNQAILFSVYPNPSHDIIYIRTIESIQEINIYSLSGQQVIHQLGAYKQINISELSEGLYLIELVNKNKRSYQKILVQ